METWETLTMSRKEVPQAGLLTAHRPRIPPKAKGRIARFWQTPQDRLVSELRLRGIATLEAATPFLPAFLADLNTRFAWPPADPRGAWRRPARSRRRAELSVHAPRRPRQHRPPRPRWVQLPRRRSYAGRRVELRECFDGRLLVFRGRCLPRHPAPRPRRSSSARAARPTAIAPARPASVRTQWSGWYLTRPPDPPRLSAKARPP